MDTYTVILSKSAKSSLARIPFYIILKLQGWIDDVENSGLMKVRKIPGYHDEPLKGNRLGQRSIRLSKAYRAIYAVDQDQKINIIRVLEVNKHEY